MWIFVAVILGIAVGAVCGYLYARTRTTALYALLQERAAQIGRADELRVESLRRIEELTEQKATLREENSSLRKECDLTARQARREMELKEKQYQERFETLKTEFKNLANEILDQKSRGLKQSNDDQLRPLFTALRDQMDKVESTLKQTREDSAARKASLDKAMEDMIARTMEVGAEADKLARALKGGDKKKQGIYGELILSQILEDSGLKQGVNFDCQHMIRDANGKAVRNEETERRMIPDVVVHFEDKDLIIDSKTSLTAYVDWCNAEDDATRAEAAQRHVQSVRRHVDELVTVSYPAYLKNARRTTVDYAVMFIPNEGAFQLMMQEAPKLWHEAYERRIIITSQLALFSMLRLIQVSWLHVEQQRNQEQILTNAGLLLKRVAEFNKYFEEVGERLTAASKSFADARNKLVDGRQSIAVSGRKLMELNVKFDSSKPLPEPRSIAPEEISSEVPEP